MHAEWLPEHVADEVALTRLVSAEECVLLVLTYPVLLLFVVYLDTSLVDHVTDLARKVEEERKLISHR